MHLLPSHLLLNNAPRRLVSVALLAVITVSPLLQGFLPPMSSGLREQENSADDGVRAQARSESWGTELARARQLRADGRYEDAAAAYRGALDRAPNAASVALAGAEAALAAKDYRAVLDLTAVAVAANAAATDAHALRAEAMYQLGDARQALGAFNAYLAAEPVGGYAAFRAAEIAEAAEDVNAAGDFYRRALDLGMSAWWEATAARRIAQIYVVADQPVEAVGWLERADTAALRVERRGLPVWYDGELVRQNAESGRAPILLELANARRGAGLIDAAIDAYSDVVALYPAAAQAEPALDALREMGALSAVTGLARGLVHFNAGRPSEAMIAFDDFRLSTTDGQRLARAAYYAALARRNAGEPVAARDALYAMARSYPDSTLSPEALWQAARLAEAIGMPGDDVVRAYLFVADEYPLSDEAARSLARAGALSLDLGDRTLARQIWDRLARFHLDVGARAQGLFFLGRASLAVGDTGGAAAFLSEATALAPLGYEGARARELLDRGSGAEPFQRGGSGILISSPSGDADACADWISTWADPAARDTIALAALGRIDRLLAISFAGPAQAEALEAIAGATASPRDLQAFAQRLADRRLYPESMYAALRLGAASPVGSAESGPPCLRRLVYPLAYQQLVREQAEQRSIDPYLLLALLRQESWFGSRAVSSADARGLSQVLPSTGADIARSLGRTGFDAEDLYRPQESIVFGAWYLAEQTRNLGERPLLAVAAYNGGSSNALRWSGRNMSIDPDDFVAAIDFAETRGYVRSIYQIYSRYQQLYASASG